MTTVTITGALGPGLTTTSMVFENVTKLHFNYEDMTIGIYYRDSPTQEEKTQYYSYTDIGTVTTSISGANTTVTIS